MAALVFSLLLACYWPALRGGLLWDDEAHVTSPGLRSLAGLGRIWTDLQATQQYYPVLHSAFWIEHRLWGDATSGYHLANVLWHGAACCLLALVLRKLKNARPSTSAAGIFPGGEWLAALLFAVHPVCVESVAWISEQKNTLSLVFYLSAALLYLEFDARRRLWSYTMALALFLLALGTKSVTATLPAALLVLFWWKRGRLAWRDAAPLVPWFVIAAASGLFTAWVERTLIGADGAAFDLTIAQRIFLAGRVVWFYLGKLFWPADLMFVYPRWHVATSLAWAGGIVGVVVVTVILWRIRGRSRTPLAAWLLFVGSLFPALGFFNVYPFIFSYVADHFQYLASLGIIASVAAGLASCLDATPLKFRVGAQVLCGVLVIALAVLTNRQSRAYVDGETLYRVTLTRNPECWMAHNNLGVILAKTPARRAEAVVHYRDALRLKPDYAEAHNNLAVELTRAPGHEAEAIEHCRQALQSRPDYAEAHCNLANALAMLPGREAEAITHYEQALHLDPFNAEIHYSFANVLAKIPGHLSEALAHYDDALRLKPDYVEAHVNLANELARQPGRIPEALAHLERALQLNPSLAEVHYNLAVQLSAIPGREADAMVHYQEALRLQPNYAKAHNNLAILYARQSRWTEARLHWQKALELNPDYEDARRNLDRLERLGKR